MDWLVKHRATLDCIAKRMVLRTAEDSEVVVISEPQNYPSNVISALKAENDMEAKSPAVKELRTVREFSDVFPEELPGLPPSREVEFGIELLPGTTPPVPGKEFMVYSDASHVGLGCALMQEGKVVESASRKLKTHEELNLRQRRWVKLLKDYDCMIEYHLGKVNVVADALSHRVKSDLRAMLSHLSWLDNGSLLAELQVKPIWIEQIKSKQLMDETLGARLRQVENGKTSDFGINSEGVLCFCGRMCIPKDNDLRQSILQEAHSSLYAMHPGGNKMYQNLRKLYWWPGLKRELMEFVGKCLVCQKKESIWVIVDRLTKSTHFVPVLTDYSLQKLARLYVAEIVRLHGVLVLRFRRKGKLSPRFIGSYRVLRRIGPVAYQLELPPELSLNHDVFHVSMLRRYPIDPSHVVVVEEIEVRLDLTFEEEPIQIIDQDVKELRRKSVPFAKVLWRNHKAEDATWEPEEGMRHQYPKLRLEVAWKWTPKEVFRREIRGKDQGVIRKKNEEIKSEEQVEPKWKLGLERWRRPAVYGGRSGAWSCGAKLLEQSSKWAINALNHASTCNDGPLITSSKHVVHRDSRAKKAG
ncbi:uncharacterized protein [Gossypium hirsutum]|uniref:Uncharacterized protein n=1 Tax=Gossypium hirsutum TaxID=3635 RepID=A0A1U8PXY0_GOSHI|nr:uncharacterized protein LOC107963051 [Gossypium hirsutum]